MHSLLWELTAHLCPVTTCVNVNCFLMQRFIPILDQLEPSMFVLIRNKAHELKAQSCLHIFQLSILQNLYLIWPHELKYTPCFGGYITIKNRYMFEFNQAMKTQQRKKTQVETHLVTVFINIFIEFTVKLDNNLQNTVPK